MIRNLSFGGSFLFGVREFGRCEGLSAVVSIGCVEASIDILQTEGRDNES